MTEKERLSQPSPSYDHRQRSAIIAGRNTTLVSIPVVYCRELGIKRGTPLKVEKRGDSLIITKR